MCVQHTTYRHLFLLINPDNWSGVALCSFRRRYDRHCYPWTKGKSAPNTLKTSPTHLKQFYIQSKEPLNDLGLPFVVFGGGAIATVTPGKKGKAP